MLIDRTNMKNPFLFLLFSVVFLSCNDNELDNLQKEPVTEQASFYAFEHEEWTFIYEGKAQQYRERSRIYQTCTSIGDTVLSIRVVNNIEFGTTLHCKVIQVHDSVVNYHKDSVQIRITNNLQYTFYDSFAKSVYLLRNAPSRTTFFKICDYDYQIGDSLCGTDNIVFKDVLWINNKPYPRFRSSMGIDIVEGLSISNSCGHFLGDAFYGYYRVISARYKNEFMEYDFMDL